MSKDNKDKDFFEQKLKSLQSELHSYSNDITSYILQLYNNDSNNNIDLKNNPFNMLNILSLDINEIIEESQKITNYSIKYSNEIKECNNIIIILTNINNIINNINECEKLINKVELIKACNLLNTIEELFLLLPSANSEIGSGKVIKILKKEKKILLSRLHSKLRRILSELITFEYGRITINKIITGLLKTEDIIIDKNITIAEVLQAIIIVNNIDECIDDILRNVWYYIMYPLFKEKKSQLPKIIISNDNNDCSNSGSSISELLFDNIVREQSRIYNSINTSTNEDRLLVQQQGQVKGGGGTFASLGISKLPLQELIPILNQVFSFLWSEVLCKDNKACESARVKLHSSPIKLFDTIIGSIAAQLPKSESELSNYRYSLEKICTEFEQNLQAFNLSDDNNANKLTNYLSNLPLIYAELRRKEILKNVRIILLSDYHNTMLAAGDAMEDELSSAGNIGDPTAVLDQSGSYAIQKLKFDSCQVSLASCRVLKLINEIMIQVCNTSKSVAKILYQSARDCLELTLAIIPMQFADIIDTVPRMGAVFYNDCQYIIHNCILITHKYKQELGKIDEVLQNTMGFIDFIPRFRQAAEKCMSIHLDEQRTTLTRLVTRINIDPISNNTNKNTKSSFTSNVGDGFRKAAFTFAADIGKKLQINNDNNLMLPDSENIIISNDDEAAVIVKRHMERLSNQWSGVLQESVYSKLLGYLFSTVINQLMSPLLTTDCIAETAANELSRIFRTIQQIRLIFPNESKDDDAMTTITSNWKKFIALTDLLELSLSEVAEYLPRKKFCYFTGNEMSNLIKALFDDTPRRDTVLTSILEMSS